jgi:hypothetical protein
VGQRLGCPYLCPLDNHRLSHGTSEGCPFLETGRLVFEVVPLAIFSECPANGHPPLSELAVPLLIRYFGDDGVVQPAIPAFIPTMQCATFHLVPRLDVSSQLSQTAQLDIIVR